MAGLATTRPSLLLRIRSSDDRAAWDQFAEIYTPLVYGFARSRGLQEADAADLAQDVLCEVSESIGRFDYDPILGRFRSWLYKVTQYRLCHWQQKSKRQAVGSGDSAVRFALEQEADPADDQAQWELEYKRHLFRWAAERAKVQFRESTWLAFWRTAVEEQAPAKVAEELQMTVGAVYIARNRVLGRLKKIVESIDGSA